VDVGGGGFIWTPGRGFTRIPPRSPVIDILERAARLQELEELKGMIPEDQRSPLSEESATTARFIEQAAANIRDQRSPT
jgi:hypothetical protein